MMRLMMCCALVLGGTTMGWGEEPPNEDEKPTLAPALVELKLKIQTNESLYQDSSAKKPLILKSRKEAKKYLEESTLDQLETSMDFKEQFLVIFAWKGSGQDQLDAVILESFPEQIHFTYRPGLTRDLRPHLRAYALRSNVILKN